MYDFFAPALPATTTDTPTTVDAPQTKAKPDADAIAMATQRALARLRAVTSPASQPASCEVVTTPAEQSAVPQPAPTPATEAPQPVVQGSDQPAKNLSGQAKNQAKGRQKKPAKKPTAADLERAKANERWRRAHPTPQRRWKCWQNLMVAAGLIPGTVLAGKTLYNNALELVGMGPNRVIPAAHAASKDPVTMALYVFAHYSMFRNDDEPKTPKELYDRWRIITDRARLLGQ